MLQYNFHTHTARCGHAEGADREYVEAAIKGGIRELGFSDHAPYVFEGGYYSNFRMRPDKIEGYVKSIQDLQREYKGEITLHIGFEAEYYPKFFPAFLEMLKPYPVEYILLAQHVLGNEMDTNVYSARPTDNVQHLWTYAHQTVEAMKTGAFTYFAHPDMLCYRENPAECEKAWRMICENAKMLNVPLEINLLGIRDHRHYPYADFWRVAGEVGVNVVAGADAHKPADVCDNASFEIAMQMVKAYGLHFLEKPTLIDPNGRNK